MALNNFIREENSLTKTIRVEGLKQFSTLLNVLGEEVKANLQPKMREIVEDIKEDAKGRCPVDTGSLQKSIRIQTSASPAGNIISIGVSAGGYITNPKTGKKVNYAAHVEYGTSRQTPQPFLRPAYLKNEQKLRHLVKQAVINSIRKHK